LSGKFRLSSGTDGMGIVNQEFAFESGAPVESSRDWLLLRRVGLIQAAFIEEPAVMRSSGLRPDAGPYADLNDTILEEALPLLRGVLEPATFRLNSEPALGEVAQYRGITFLLTRFSTTARFDFTCWRLPAVLPDVPWPEVLGPS
jgi:hypothetical protein